MTRSRLGVLLALAGAVVLLVPTVSLAQRWGGGWRVGRPGFFFGSGYPYGTSWGYYRGYSPYYYGYNPVWDAPGYYSPYGYGYGARYNTYVSPRFDYQRAYPADADSAMPAADQGRGVLATIRVPTPDAQLWIEGKEMETGGTARSFLSPPLEPNQRYNYTFRARWTDPNGKQVEQTREVPVQAGSRITVDFNRPEKRTGTRRESGYGSDSERPLPNRPEGAAPAEPRSNTPPAAPPRPRDNKSDRENKPNPDDNKKEQP